MLCLPTTCTLLSWLHFPSLGTPCHPLGKMSQIPLGCEFYHMICKQCLCFCFLCCELPVDRSLSLCVGLPVSICLLTYNGHLIRNQELLRDGKNKNDETARPRINRQVTDQNSFQYHPPCLSPELLMEPAEPLLPEPTSKSQIRGDRKWNGSCQGLGWSI